MYEARQHKDKVSRRIETDDVCQRTKGNTKNMIHHKEELSDIDWFVVSRDIERAKMYCEYWKKRPVLFRHLASYKLNLRPVEQRTYIPQLTKIINVLSGLNRSNFKKDIGNNNNYCAEVNPEKSNHNITLGGEYMKLFCKGKDSRAGALIHEITHFNDVMGTDDHAYGSKADVLSHKGLSSVLGRNNADTWEYIIELCPLNYMNKYQRLRKLLHQKRRK